MLWENCDGVRVLLVVVETTDFVKRIGDYICSVVPTCGISECQ